MNSELMEIISSITDLKQGLSRTFLCDDEDWAVRRNRAILGKHSLLEVILSFLECF